MTKGQIKNVILGLAVATVLTAMFFLASIQIGGYEDIDIQGGAFYTFVLSLIISLAVIPKIASALKKEK